MESQEPIYSDSTENSDSKPFSIEELQSGNLIQVRGEIEPVEVTSFLLGKSGEKVMAQVRNVVTGKQRDVAASDILRKIEGEQGQSHSIDLAGTLTAEIANDQIESWRNPKK